MRAFASAWQGILLALVLLGGAAPAGQQNAPPGEEAEPAPRTEAERLQALLRERLEVRRQMERHFRSLLELGLIDLLEMHRATIAVIQAELDLEQTAGKRIALWERWVEVARSIEKRIEHDVQQGIGSEITLLEARVSRIDAQIGLERERLAAEPVPRAAK